MKELELKDPCFKDDFKSGKVTLNKNGHVTNISDMAYKRLLHGLESENSTCYLCGENMLFKMKKNSVTGINNIEVSSWQYAEVGLKRMETEGVCSMADHSKQEGAYKISIPTGELVIGNYFLDKDGEYAFDVPEKEKYGEKYNINQIKGQNNRAEFIADKYNVGYVQINSSVEVWCSKDKNKILLVMEPSDWEEEGKKDEKFNTDFRKKYKKIGELDQRVWRYEFADKSIVNNHKAQVSKEYQHLEIKVPKGRYTVKHHYGKMYFGLNNKRFVITTEIELNTNTREILTEKK